MSCQQQLRISASRIRRVANNNYQKLSKTLCEKLAKLCLDYDTYVYFLAYRNGRFNGFGKFYPTPAIKTPSRCYRASQRQKLAFHQPTSRPCSTGHGAISTHSAKRSMHHGEKRKERATLE
ncbi:hypothetical protein BU23DRAFT_562129 [Bimuria novae-zelandiae CBS 107.79]|uniref:Uncharacterized protein n=1 Tax=Bimuria novae-zelandiae CBS 107.79 TaxID=1447943 RepID=A0A6A5UKA4_9PLEO|nr:hypothetical protein BU23DRAFT_562129 [Bimuria novae-zelandiae CBS 107.79]